MNGAEYIAEFLRQREVKNVFLLTGGACAFIIDAIARNEGVKYTCFQHEQAAAMAADSLWRVDKSMGVTVATSGPGATNLITGIASSYFDSIPSFHITGQVNKAESSDFMGARVRQAGFQETNIVEMVKPITKYAVQVQNIEELKIELEKAWNIAIADRKGPVLIDVPMNVQKEEAGDVIEYKKPKEEIISQDSYQNIAGQINKFFEGSKRPLILFGAGIGLSGSEKYVENFINQNDVPFVSSWNGMTYFNHNSKNYCGNIGVYGNRGANFILQNCDKLLVLGSRLDNRQRSGNAKNFAISSEVMVIDVDGEELTKYQKDNYLTVNFNLRDFNHISSFLKMPKIDGQWQDFVSKMKNKYYGKDISKFHKEHNSLSPYAVIQEINKLVEDDAIIVGDTGAALCWLFQMFKRTNQIIYTSGGNSPMGYSLPAAIGAAISQPNKQIISFNGDGGFQLNIQELQTIKHYNLKVKIVILNNAGYGIIKQFQDLYFEGRHEATGEGYSCPDFGKIAEAYGLNYFQINKIDDLNKDIFLGDNSSIIDIKFHPNTFTEPKLELGKPIHNQFPYLSDAEFEENMLPTLKK